MDLKRPKPKLVRHRNNRDRFAEAINDARAQLLEYQDWFENRRNRNMLTERLGMEVYRPKLAVIVGRSAEFANAYERQKLSSREPIEIVTYDDLLKYAQQRRIIIKGNDISS